MQCNPFLTAFNVCANVCSCSGFERFWCSNTFAAHSLCSKIHHSQAPILPSNSFPARYTARFNFIIVNNTRLRKIAISLWDLCRQWYLSVCVSSLVLISFFEVEWRGSSKEVSNLITCNKTSQTWQVILSVLFCYERCFPISPSLELWCDERTSAVVSTFLNHSFVW